MMGPMPFPTRRRRGLAVAALAVALLTVPAPAAQAAGPAAPPVSGANLGPDRLPACSAVVQAMTPTAKLAQRLMVGVDAADPAGTVQTVRDGQVGGIFIGGNATELLRGQSLREVQAVAPIPVAGSGDDHGRRGPRHGQRPRHPATPPAV